MARGSTSKNSKNNNLDGFSAATVFEKEQGITYKDFLILPGYIDFAPQDVSLETQVTRNVRTKLPLISSPMDTVTESQMAITLALLGGIGIIHNNLSIEDQAAQVERYRGRESSPDRVESADDAGASAERDDGDAGRRTVAQDRGDLVFIGG